MFFYAIDILIIRKNDPAEYKAKYTNIFPNAKIFV